jgi:tRNA (cmo5U34)-methyltransferase
LSAAAPTGGTTWQADDVVGRYLGERRSIIPFRAQGYEILGTLVERHGRPVRRVLDLGAGDGVIAKLLLERYPAAHAVLVDFSAPMLAAADQQMGDRSRWSVVVADLADPAWVSELPSGEHYDAIVSGFCIHHLEDERKRALYEEIFGLLEPGGVFLNWEHVTPGALAEGMFDETMIAGLVQLEQKKPEPRSAEEVARAHYERPDAADNRLSPADDQCDWLRAIGFEGVDTYFKWLELALFGGTRPERTA